MARVLNLALGTTVLGGVAQTPGPCATFDTKGSCGLKFGETRSLSSSRSWISRSENGSKQRRGRSLNVLCAVKAAEADGSRRTSGGDPWQRSRDSSNGYGSLDIRAAKKGSPPLMPAVMTPSGPADLATVLLRNRIVFVGSPVNSQVAQKVISQLLTLAAIDEDEEIKMYINCPGGSTYSVLAIYDTMSWIKPKVSTVCFGIAASQGALLLAGGEKGRRFAMPNARIMIHQPQGGCGGTADDVRRQVNEVMQSRDDAGIDLGYLFLQRNRSMKIDKMYSAFTGQPVERVQNFTDRDRFFSAAEAMEFGLIDGLLETEY